MTSRFYSFPRKCEEKKDNNVIRIGFCCRSDLNHPPTAAGGIWTFRTVSEVGGIYIGIIQARYPIAVSKPRSDHSYSGFWPGFA